MATVTTKVCDRCGEKLKVTGWTSKLPWKKSRKIKLLKLFNGNFDGYSYSEEEYELCRKCTFKLSLFLSGQYDISDDKRQA